VTTSLNEIQKEITELKARLNQCNDQKEKLYREKEVVGRQISSSIREFKKLREERNSLTAEVRLLKEERKKFHELIKTEIKEVKELREGTEEVDFHGAGRIRKEIEMIDRKIETEAPSFEKEKAMMKRINELKKQLKQKQEAEEHWKKSKAVSHDIEESKHKADSVHKTVSERAALSQERHEKMLVLSKKVDELKEQEKTIIEKIKPIKDDMDAVSKQLEEKLMQAGQLGFQAKEEKQRKEDTRKSSNQKKFEDLLAIVEEKIKKGEKLTTEDLIVMQGKKE